MKDTWVFAKQRMQRLEEEGSRPRGRWGGPSGESGLYCLNSVRGLCVEGEGEVA